MRQAGCEGGCGLEDGLGLVARMLARSGFEDAGIGGGAPLAGPDTSFTPFPGSDSRGLFMLYERADRAGIGGGFSGGSFPTAPVESFRVGGCGARWGGREGRLGGEATSTVVTFGFDLVGFSPLLDLSISRYRFST